MIQFEKFWKGEISESRETKLEFYFDHKKVFRFECYLDNMCKNKRINITKFRLSNHRLPVEVMRYQQIKREERICPICKLDEIGDERHYLLKCENGKIQKVRETLRSTIKRIQPQCANFQDKEIMKYCIAR